MATKEVFFKPGKLSSSERAVVTDTSARAIISAETKAREKKTERLRALRLAQPVVEPKKKTRK